MLRGEDDWVDYWSACVLLWVGERSGQMFLVIYTLQDEVIQGRRSGVGTVWVKEDGDWKGWNLLWSSRVCVYMGSGNENE